MGECLTSYLMSTVRFYDVRVVSYDPAMSLVISCFSFHIPLSTSLHCDLFSSFPLFTRDTLPRVLQKRDMETCIKEMDLKWRYFPTPPPLTLHDSKSSMGETYKL